MAHKPQCPSSKRCQSRQPVSVSAELAGFHREYLNQGTTSTANHATDSNLDFIPNPTIDTTRQHWHHLAASHGPQTAMPVLQTVPITPTGVDLSRRRRVPGAHPRVPPRTPGTNHSKQYESAPTSPNSSADNTHEARNNTQLPQHRPKDPLRTQRTYPQVRISTIHPQVSLEKHKALSPTPRLSL